MEWWESFLDVLRAFITVFGDRGHVLRFRSVFAMPVRASNQLKRWKLRVFSWRWEGLEIILGDLFESFDIMDFFVLEKMKTNSKGANALYETVAVGCTDPSFVGRVGILLSITRRIGHWMRWCEGCWCHEHILISAADWVERHELLERAGVPGGRDMTTSFCLVYQYAGYRCRSFCFAK